MKNKLLLPGIMLTALAAGTSSSSAGEPVNIVTNIADISVNTTWYNTNVYLLDGFVHVLAPAELTIQPGTIIKGLSAGSITSGESASALFVTAGAKIHAVGTAARPIIFTTEFDDTSVANDMGIYDRGLWGGVIVMGKAVLNTAVDTTGNTNSPKYDVFEGLPDNQINGQNVYRFGGNNNADNSGEIQYLSIRHGGFQFLANKELNGLSMGAVGSGTTIDHVEAYAIADDGFEFFGGTVNTRYLVSAFNDDDTFDADQGYSGKNQFWFSIQENGKRDSGGEWNGEPNGIAVSNAPISNFQLYNATFIGAGGNGTGQSNVNNGLVIREYSVPRVYNSILTDFNNVNGTVVFDGTNRSVTTRGINVSDARSLVLLTNGVMDLRENIVHGFSNVVNNGAAVLFSDASRSNITVNPLLTSISRIRNASLDPRPQPGSPALTTTITPPNDGFYTQVRFKGAFDTNTLWLKGWTALDALGFLPGGNAEESTDVITIVNDISVNTFWFNTNVYLLNGFIHVLAPAELTIQPGTIIKGLSAGSITSGESASALFVTAGAKIHAAGTPAHPIVFTTEFDDTGERDDMGLYDRGLWGGVIVMGKAVLNTAVDTTGNTNSPKYDVFEGLPDNQITGQYVYRFGGNNDADNSGEIQYVSIRHGGFQFLANKELNGLSLGAVGSGTTIDHVEAYAIADDGFEFFGGTVNTKYLVSAFNDDDTFDTDQGYSGKNQFWFSIQENGRRDSGGEWNGEPNGIAVSNVPIANFQLYNATFIGAGGNGTGQSNVNNGLVIREYSSPRVYNSIFTDFNNVNGTVVFDGTNRSVTTRGINVSDARSLVLLTNGVMDLRENIVHGFSNVVNSGAAVLFSDASRSNSTVNPLLTSISRVNDHGLDPRLAANSPALTTSILAPNDGFYTAAGYKGAFSANLWMQTWTALDFLGYLPSDTIITPASAIVVPPNPVTLSITLNGASADITCSSQAGYTYTLESTTDVSPASWAPATGVTPSNSQTGTGGTITFSASVTGGRYFRVSAQ